MPSVLVCPDPTCQTPAEIIGQWTFDSTDGPVEHVKTSCAAGHIFTPRTESLAAAGPGAALHPVLNRCRPRRSGRPTAGWLATRPACTASEGIP